MKSLICCIALMVNCLLAFGQAAPAPVQVDTLPDKQIAEVTVSAHFLPTDVRNTVNTVRVIDRQTFERRGAVNLDEVLQSEAGIRLTQDAALGSSVGINGMSGENVKILVDGVPVLGRLFGSVDAGQLPLGTVQQIEIIEGAQSLLYGSSASAGVINLVSRKTQATPFEFEANTQLESNGFRNLQGRAGVKMGKLLWQITGNQLEFQPQIDTSLGRDQLWNPKSQGALRSVLRYSPSERLDVRLTLGIFKEQVDNLGELRRPTYKPYAFDDYFRTRRSDATLHAEGWLKKRWFWQTTAGLNNFYRIKNSYRFDFDDAKQTLLEEQQDTSNSIGFTARATMASDHKDKRFNFLFGLENYFENMEGKRILDTTLSVSGQASVDEFAAFASTKATFLDKRLTLQGGARWTQNQRFGAAVTPSVWLLWKLRPTWQLRMSYASGFRSPSLKELYLNFQDNNHFLTGNSSLRPELSDNLRAELRWEQNRTNKIQLKATASAFYNSVRDRIILTELGNPNPNAPVQYSYANLAKWKTIGTGFSVQVGYRDFIQFNSAVIVTGYFTQTEEADTLSSYNWSPDWVNELRFNFLESKLGVTLWHKYTGETPYFSENLGQSELGKIADWNMLNASVNYSLLKNKIRLTTGVKNLLDTKQVRSGATDALGHVVGGDNLLVHWGRTYFLNAVVTFGK